jgi:hypothetical protein
MRLSYTSAVVAAAVAFSAAAAAQTTPPSNSMPQNVPDEPMPGTTAKSQPAPAQTEPTPTQPQTTPGAPDQKGSAQASASGATTAATAADVKAGVSVYDQKGGVVGKIDSVSGKNAVIDTGTARAQIPISSFAKSDKGLVISMTKAELEAAAKKSPPKPK